MQSQHPSPQSRVKQIGRVLITRRITLDPARHSKRPGWMESIRARLDEPPSERVIIDLETGARANYAPDTLRDLEDLYRLRKGSLEEALQGGQLVADDGAVLYPPPPAAAPSQPSAAESLRAEIVRQAMDLAMEAQAALELEGLPDDEAVDDAMTSLRRAMEAGKAQVRLILDTERRARGERPKE